MRLISTSGKGQGGGQRGIHNEPLADGGQDSGVYVSRHDLLRSHAMNEEIKKKKKKVGATA